MYYWVTKFAGVEKLHEKSIWQEYKQGYKLYIEC